MDFDIATGIVTFIERGKDTVLAGINDVNQALSGVGNVNVRVSFSDLLVQLGSVDAAVDAVREKLASGQNVNFNFAEVARFTGSLEAAAEAQVMLGVAAGQAQNAINRQNQSLEEGQRPARSGTLNIDQNAARSINRISAAAADLIPAGLTLEEFEQRLRQLAASGNFDINIDTAQAVSALDLTTDEANDLLLRLNELQNVRVNINTRQAERALSGAGRSLGGSFNNVGFQVGQAFEDATVGFSLNGFEGAIRGAGNNVSFLVNQFASRLNPEIASAVSLTAGVGVAALIAAGPLADWFQGVQRAREEAERFTEQIRQVGSAISNVRIAQLRAEFSIEDQTTTDDIENEIRQLERNRATIDARLEIDRGNISDIENRLRDAFRRFQSTATPLGGILDTETNEIFSGAREAADQGNFQSAIAQFRAIVTPLLTGRGVASEIQSLAEDFEELEKTIRENGSQSIAASSAINRLSESLENITESEFVLDTQDARDQISVLLGSLSEADARFRELERRRPFGREFTEQQTIEVQALINTDLALESLRDIRSELETPLEVAISDLDELQNIRNTLSRDQFSDRDFEDATELIRLNFESDLESLRGESITGRGAIDDLANAIQDAALDRENLAEQKRQSIALERMRDQLRDMPDRIAEIIGRTGVIN